MWVGSVNQIGVGLRDRPRQLLHTLRNFVFAWLLKHVCQLRAVLFSRRDQLQALVALLSFALAKDNFSQRTKQAKFQGSAEPGKRLVPAEILIFGHKSPPGSMAVVFPL